MRKRVINFILFVAILISVFQIDNQGVIAQVQSTPFSVHGRVTDGYGNGLAGVRVFADSKYKTFLPLISSPASTMISDIQIESDIQFYYSAVTDADGYYTIDAIPNGTYILQVDLPGVTFNPEKREITAETTGSQDFDLHISDPIITPETVVLTNLSNQYLDVASYDGESFYFTQMTSELEQVDVGDIIVSDVSSADPDGFFRKVTGLTPQDSGVLLTTIPATLEESIQDGSAFLMETMQPTQVQSIRALDGVSMLESDVNSPLTFYFEVNNVVLYDDDGDPATTYDQIKADGSIEFEMEFIFYLDMQGFQVQRFSMTNENTLRDTLEIYAEIELLSLEEEAILSEMYFSPITFMIGPVPIVFVPKLDLVVGVDGSVKVGISTEVSHEFSMRAGVQYRYSSGWSPISEISSTFTFTPPHLTFEMTLKGYFGARFNLYLYGVAGPFVKITPYLEIKVEPFETPWWTLYGGIDVPVGFKAHDTLEKLLDLEDYEVYAIGLKQVIAQAQVVDPGEMVFVPAGEFQMGCDPEHNGGYSCETESLPLHTVYLDAYYIDQTEVTNAQYAECVTAGACDEPYFSSSYTRDSYYGNPEFDDYPVIWVGWYDAEDYCTWAGKRLPTEAEWEKAARGTTVRAYPWGDGDPNCSLANSDKYIPGGDYCVGDTSQVGTYPAGASQYGALDMAGNAYEWVSDWYSTTYYSGSPYANPQGPSSGEYKVLRGGSWYFFWIQLLTSHKGVGELFIHRDDGGFRCASSSSPDNNPPNPPSAPTPPDQATNQPLDIMLSWSGSDPDGDLLVYDVYFDAENNNPSAKIADHQTSTELSVGPLLENTSYYWKVVAFDEFGAATEGPVWEFTTQGDITPGEMVFVPAGEFQMGCDWEHNGGYTTYWPDEHPLHEVYLDTYTIDLTEVTNSQYQQCVIARACDTPYYSASWTRSSYYGNSEFDDYPVVYISWQDASDYCTWAGKRLPTEAEWEKAARGTTPRAYPWGDSEPNCSLANGHSCVGDTSAVGSYPGGASPYGALDMAGNVWEWVSDWYNVEYYGNSPYSNPTGPIDGSGKVIRGGSGIYDWESLRVAKKTAMGIYNYNYGDIGFRCASSLDYPSNNFPDPAENPYPPLGMEGVNANVTLQWTASDPDNDTLVFDVYLDPIITYPTTKIADHQSLTSVSPASLSANTTYYWQVITFDEHGSSTASPVWQFTVEDGTPGEMVFVPAGEFQMGCDQNHNSFYTCTSNSEPLHTVYLDAFYIEKTEVTNLQYGDCVSSGTCNVPSNISSATRTSYFGNPEYENYPVIYVDWYDAEDYCTWAGKRLPTEAEWEKAARGTTPRAYPWGDHNSSCNLTNYSYCIDDTSAVGSYPAGASPYGALDMAGNVWEWVNDWYSGTYYIESPSINPLGPVIGDTKTIRGGDWRSDSRIILTATRGALPTLSSWDSMGFRCASSSAP